MAKLEGLMPAMKLKCHLKKKHVFIAWVGYLKAHSLFQLMEVADKDPEKRLSSFPYIKHLGRDEYLRQKISE